MAISAAEVKALRDATGVGMMDCKRALEQADGDVEKAKDLLRQQGLAKGDKRAGRTTADGAVAIAISDDLAQAVVLELNCETDFVGRTDDFRALAQQLAQGALASGAQTPDDVDAADAINEAVSRLGEAIRVGRLVRWTAAADGKLGSYLHTATHRVAVLVELAVEGDIAAEAVTDAAREMGMQVCAMQPICVGREDVPAERLDREKEVLRQAADMANKPPQIQDKIIEGRLGKFYAEVCLVEQQYAKDQDLKVHQYLEQAGKAAGGKLGVRRFERIEVGRD